MKNVDEIIQNLRDKDIWNEEILSYIETLIKKEIWTNIVIAGKEYDGYSISSHGNLISHFKQIRSNGLIVTKIVDPTIKKPCKFSPSKDKNGRITSMYKKIHLPKGFFEGTYLENENYFSQASTSFAYRRTPHQLVMEAFLPIFKYPPKRLEFFWNDLAIGVKQWIYESVIIDHIDNDPTHNCIWNLRYGTAGENTRWAKEHYGGNFTNKINSAPKVKKNSILSFI